ncbi:MAG: SAM-dependent methyltransferase [Alphaproteobacteria bacterium]|nr:SAM-dependent methyltransferase [Alphaproteobacteria bacterium]
MKRPKYIRRFKQFLANRYLRFQINRAAAPLVPILKDIIRRQGPLTLERYMEITLQHPRYGYYRKGNPIGAHGDFHTAPEISPLFGEMIGVWCLNAWEKMGKPESFTLLELGPGRGTLLNDLLRATSSAPDFHKALNIRLIESNATLRALQQEILAKFSPVHIENLAQLNAEPILVIANEFFDNIPARLFLNAPSGWMERRVDCKNGSLFFVDEKITDPSTKKFLNDNLKEAKPWGAYEISNQSRQIIEKISAHIVRHGGTALVIDYGHAAPSGQPTFAAWSQHIYTNLLTSPGQTDITVGVDFSALRRAAETQGARVTDLKGQGDFLLELGIKTQAYKREASPPEKNKIVAALDKLTSPAEMGELWKVMIILQNNTNHAFS